MQATVAFAILPLAMINVSCMHNSNDCFLIAVGGHLLFVLIVAVVAAVAVTCRCCYCYCCSYCERCYCWVCVLAKGPLTSTG